MHHLRLFLVVVAVLATASGCYTECANNADCATGEACRFTDDGDAGLCAPEARVENPGEGEGDVAGAVRAFAGVVERLVLLGTGQRKG